MPTYHPRPQNISPQASRPRTPVRCAASPSRRGWPLIARPRSRATRELSPSAPTTTRHRSSDRSPCRRTRAPRTAPPSTINRSTAVPLPHLDAAPGGCPHERGVEHGAHHGQPMGRGRCVAGPPVVVPRHRGPVVGHDPHPREARRLGGLDRGQHPEVREVPGRLGADALRARLVPRERRTIHQQDVEPGAGGEDGRGRAGRPATDHQDVTHRRRSRRPPPPCRRG